MFDFNELIQDHLNRAARSEAPLDARGDRVLRYPWYLFVVMGVVLCLAIAIALQPDVHGRYIFALVIAAIGVFGLLDISTSVRIAERAIIVRRVWGETVLRRDRIESLRVGQLTGLRITAAGKTASVGLQLPGLASLWEALSVSAPASVFAAAFAKYNRLTRP